jgi:hypothetical protein
MRILVGSIQKSLRLTVAWASSARFSGLVESDASELSPEYREQKQSMGFETPLVLFAIEGLPALFSRLSQTRKTRFEAVRSAGWQRAVRWTAVASGCDDPDADETN